MMDLLQSWDTGLFRLINLGLSNPLFDRVMPIFSNTPFFGPAVFALLVLLIWKGGVRGRLCALMLVVGIFLADGCISNTLKHAIGRLRPFNVITDAHVLVGRSGSGSMPSSHAANWFAATMVCFIYYRRSWRFMLPLACLVSFSRIYNGVHYPSDILVGAILGAGAGAAGAWLIATFWGWFGRKWLPRWWVKLPDLLNPDKSVPTSSASAIAAVSEDQHWMRLGYLVTGLLFLIRLIYLGSGRIDLSEDEAYQWVWSKHLALSYYSKPPLIAYTQFLGTHLWGDTPFGVRFFSPVIAGILSVLLLRFLAGVINARVAFIFLLITCTTPLMAVGATLLTIDPLSVLFWTAAMVAGWRASQPDGRTRDWLWVGLWMGLGFLSKYTNLVQLISWAVFFALWAPARKHLRRPGPYLAVLINLICTLPVVIWNTQHNWVTLENVFGNGRLNKTWEPTLKYLGEFVGTEFGLLNPVFFVAAMWAMIAFWKRDRRNPLALYLFSMGAPLFLGYFLLSFHSRVLQNWIAPSVLPLFCLMAVYWSGRWAENGVVLKRWLVAGLCIGLFVVTVIHESELISKIVQHPIPSKLDPLRRVRGWRSLAEMVGAAQQKLELDGKPAFIIADQYGLTGEISIYLDRARERVEGEPLVYCRRGSRPENQFYFWPSYDQRKGQNAIFVWDAPKFAFRPGWFTHWLAGSSDLYLPPEATPRTLPPEIKQRFESVTDLGIKDVLWKGRVMRRVQLFECRNLQ